MDKYGLTLKINSENIVVFRAFTLFSDVFDSKMNADGAISKLWKDLKIEFELQEEQKSIIKSIINREDDFCRFTHVHFWIKYGPRELATSCLKVICIWKWPPIWQDLSQPISTSENRVKARNVTMFSPFILRVRPYLSIRSVIFLLPQELCDWVSQSGCAYAFSMKALTPSQTEVNNR